MIWVKIMMTLKLILRHSYASIVFYDLGYVFGAHPVMTRIDRNE